MLGALMLVGLATLAHVFADATQGPIYYATHKTSHGFLEVQKPSHFANDCLAIFINRDRSHLLPTVQHVPPGTFSSDHSEMQKSLSRCTAHQTT